MFTDRTSLLIVVFVLLVIVTVAQCGTGCAGNQQVPFDNKNLYVKGASLVIVISTSHWIAELTSSANEDETLAYYNKYKEHEIAPDGDQVVMYFREAYNGWARVRAPLDEGIVREAYLETWDGKSSPAFDCVPDIERPKRRVCVLNKPD